MQLTPPSNSSKHVFLTALDYALSLSSHPSPPTPPFCLEIQTSAQQQIDFMLLHDPHTTPLLFSDIHVASFFTSSLSLLFSRFLSYFSHYSLLSSELTLLRTLSIFDWLCNILPKFNLLRVFVLHWSYVSLDILTVVQRPEFDSALWNLKLKLIEITAKVLDAVAYGTVVVPPDIKVQLLNAWLPFIQKMKPVFDDQITMDDELCHTIEAAMVSMILTLPSNDQALLLAAWMESSHLGFPDLTEAFEIWCYRTKSSNRRLLLGIHSPSNASLTSNLSP